MKTILSHFLVLSLLLTLSCNKDDGALSPYSVAIKLTDAPTTLYQKVIIDIEQIEIKRKDGDSETLDINAKVDLLSFQNGRDTLLRNIEMEGGDYIKELRFILGQNNSIVLSDGTQVPLRTPSAQQSGLKIKIDNKKGDAPSFNLILDFDAHRSIVQQGNGEYSLKPVIRAFFKEETGSLEGTVIPADIACWAILINNVDTIATSLCNSKDRNSYYIGGLANGSYDLHIVPLEPNYNSEILPIQITSSTTITVDPINLQIK